MNLLSQSDSIRHMITKPNETHSLLPMKSAQEPVKLEKSALRDTSEARKIKIRKAAEGFEAVFIRQFLRIMRKTVPDGGMFGKGTVGDIYGDMMDNALAEVMSKRSIFGLKDMLYRQLVRESDTSRDAVVQNMKKGFKKSHKNDDI